MLQKFSKVVGGSFGMKYMNNNGFLVVGLLDFLLDEEEIHHVFKTAV